MLEDAVTRGDGFSEVKALAAFLQRYVLTHFNTEEQVMLSGNYPASAQHAGEHDQCKNRIFQFKHFIETESDRKKIVSVAYSMLGIWVRDHILNHDIQFIQYIKEKKNMESCIDIDYPWTPEESRLWSPELLVGAPDIDEQHMALVKWMEYIQNTKLLSGDEIRNLLNFVHGFIFMHFTDEEIFMIDAQFPELQRHTEQHNATRMNFFEVKKWIDGKLDPLDMRNMVLELFEGYFEHIKTYDAQFKWYVADKQTQQ